MKYPKLSAAIDDMLSKLVRDNGEATILALIEMASKPVEVPPEKLPPIPVTKEVILDGD